MGTYTTNYNLFMPTIGEQGWGELVNGNFVTIDATMKSLSNSIGALEPLSIIQVDDNQNVTFPGKISANGGFELDSICKITTETGVISGMYLNFEYLLCSGTSANSTFTYKQNPICNTVRFLLKYKSGNTSNANLTFKVLINGAEISTWTPWGTSAQTKYTDFVTLKDSDTVTVKLQNVAYNGQGEIYLAIASFLSNA